MTRWDDIEPGREWLLDEHNVDLAEREGLYEGYGLPPEREESDDGTDADRTH